MLLKEEAKVEESLLEVLQKLTFFQMCNEEGSLQALLISNMDLLTLLQEISLKNNYKKTSKKL